jgi:nickel/cobalt exporter
MPLTTLCATAMAIGAGHTILGPDHYVPFVAMARAGHWSAARTAAVTVACGLGHVAGSVAIGLVGIAAGMAVERVEGLEGLRGDAAAWLLVAAGLAYAAWGYVRPPHPTGTCERPCSPMSRLPAGEAGRGPGEGDLHITGHGPGTLALPCPGGRGWESDGRAAHGSNRSVWAPWGLFLIFLFGPCEPLIPLLMYPAATHGPVAVGAVALAFLAATVGTMLAAVLALRAGCAVVQASRLERHAHTLAGLAVTACGLLVLAGL